MKFIQLCLFIVFSFSLYAQESPETSHTIHHEKNYLYLPSSKKLEFTTEDKNMIVEYRYLFILFFLTTIILLFIVANKNRQLHYYKMRLFNFSTKQEQKKIDILTKKEEIVSYVSHELRTPMTAIKGLTHLILESELNPLQKEYLSKIDETSQYMLTLLNDILDLSKIEASKLKLEKTEFNLNDIVNYIYNVVSIQAKNNNLNILVFVEKDVPSNILGDPLRLGQILINLMSNAIKFTKDGEVTLDVKKISSHKDKILLQFTVSDTGIGMTKEQMAKLFNSFYQAEESISRKYGGSGLGLNISKNLVELMGGEIQVESKKGFGTTFYFTLPFYLKDYNEKRQYRLPSQDLLNKNILVIDSCNKNAIPLTQALSYFKYNVHNIPSVDDLGDEKAENVYDIIIINLQNLNETAIETMQKMQKEQNSKLVILSPLYSSLNATLSKELHIDAYLKPPITLQNTLNLLIELYHKPNIAKTRKDLLIDLLQKYAGKKVLVVEDNELNYKVIAGMLAKTGIETSHAEDGEKALQLIEENIKFDLILMDINMPGINGYEASMRIRQNRTLNHMPIVALSADNSKAAKEKAIACGMQGYLLKPIKLNDFYSKIIELLKKQNS